MEKELMVKDQAALSVDVDFDSSVLQDIDMHDLLIPKLLLAQSTSKLVQDEKCLAGQQVNSVTGEVVADRGQDAEFVILHSFKSWVRYLMEDGQPKFIGEVPFSVENSNLPREEETPEGTIKNQICLSFFILPKKEAHLASTLPMLASMKMTNFTTGRALINHIAQLGAIKKNPWAKSIVLSSVKKSNDKSTWYIQQYRMGSIIDMSTEEGQAINENAKMWRNIVKGGNVKVDTEEDAQVVSPESIGNEF